MSQRAEVSVQKFIDAMRPQTEQLLAEVPHRVKGPGKRWHLDNAEAVMALEALDQSHLWDEYLRTCAWESN